MAQQLKACRARDGLTLQQLASRCGVAASTIHKIESQQMVPTVSVLLKIARGLGRRPEELVRDRFRDVGEPLGAIHASDADGSDTDGGTFFDRGVGAWRIDCARGEHLDLITLAPGQRAILFIERGQAELGSHRRRTRLATGECIELQGEQFALSSEPTDPVAALLIVSPAGRLAEVLGPPNAAPRPHPRPSLATSPPQAPAHPGSSAGR